MFISEEVFVPGKSAEVELKPSQAMRIGAKLRPQCQYAPFSAGRSCALGAIWEGYGNPYRTAMESVCPVYELANKKLGPVMTSRVYSLNDNGATREDIADWLEGQGL
jgi:hypothetical protein